MDSAIAELHAADHNGVLMWLFEILRHPLPARFNGAGRYAAHLPAMPPSVLFNYSRAQAWYYSTRTREADAALPPAGASSMGAPGHASPGANQSRASDSASFKTARSAHSTGGAAAAEGASVVEPSNALAEPEGGGGSTSPSHRHRSPAPGDGAPPPDAAVGSSGSSDRFRIEYHKRKSASLTTHAIVSAMCPSYAGIVRRLLEAEEGKERGRLAQRKRDDADREARGLSPLHGAGGEHRDRSGGRRAPPGFSMSAVTQQLPSGVVCAQAIRRSDHARGERRGAGGSSMAAGVAMPASRAEAAVQYFDEYELGQLLFHGTLDYALLQRFSHPSASHSHDPTYNATFVADWQPSYCFVSTCRGLLPLSETHRPTQLRADTTDPRVSEYRGTPGSQVQQALCNACNALAERVFFATNGIRLRKMSVVFKIDARNQVLLQWCQSAAVATGPDVLTARDELVERLPYSHAQQRRPTPASAPTAPTADRDRAASIASLAPPDDAGLSSLSDSEDGDRAAAAGHPPPGHVTSSLAGGHLAGGRSQTPANGQDGGRHSPSKLSLRDRLAAARHRTEAAYGPVRPRGLLTRLRLDYMRYQQATAHGHAGGGASIRPGALAPPPPSSPGAVGRGPTTLRDLLRPGQEELARDAAFERLAPSAWARRRRLRRNPSVCNLLGLVERSPDAPARTYGQQGHATSADAGAKSASRPGSAAPHGGLGQLSPDASTTFRHLPADTSHATDASPRGPPLSDGGTCSDSDASNGNATEYVDNVTWGQPSQLDCTLLLPLDRNEPFSINRIAADAGRLGYRNAYLATMRSAATTSTPTQPLKRR